MVGAVAAGALNFQDPIDEVFHIRGARPDIDDGADALSRPKIVMYGAEKTVLAAAVNPGGANDIASGARFDHSSFSGDLGSSVYVNRSRPILDRVRRAADRLAIKSILRAEVNNLRAHAVGRFSEKS